MNKKNCSRYTPEQRLMIIREYETGTATATEVAKKYGLKYPSIIAMWRSRLQESKKNRNFAAFLRGGCPQWENPASAGKVIYQLC